MLVSKLVASSRSWLFAASLAGSAHAHVYLVDDTAAPGVQFPSIVDAVAAAQPGDVVLVRAGNYLSFQVTEGITIFGIDAGVLVWGGFTVHDVPADERFRAIGIVTTTLMGSAPHVEVSNCAGAVILDRIANSGTTRISNSADVRVRECQLRGRPGQIDGIGSGASGCDVLDSRVEIVDSLLVGGAGLGPPMSVSLGGGGAGLALVGSSEVHVARSTLTGGSGGSSASVETGGPGGDALFAGGTSEVRCRVLVTGTPAHVFSGGAGGAGALAQGAPGSGIAAASSDLRVSGVTVDGTALDSASSLVVPGRPDPILEKLGGSLIGAPAPFAVRGVPGSQVEIVLGRQPVIVESPGLDEDVLALPGRITNVGTIGSNGLLQFDLIAPGSWPQFLTLVAQARVTLPDGSVLRTQSVPLLFY